MKAGSVREPGRRDTMPDAGIKTLKRFGSWAFRFPVRRPKTFIVLCILGVLSITPIIIVTRTHLIVHASRYPLDRPGTPVLEVQNEGFTCGVHAVHAIYSAYGLTPDEERVRWRLGVDTKTLLWDRETTGSLHSDVYMVLRQDGFDVRSIDPGEEAGHENIISHLRDGHMALVLIKRRENGNLHWVSAMYENEEEYMIYDSLFPEPYPENREFSRDHVVSFLAVTPSGRLKTGFLESFGHLIDGSAELDAYAKRMKQLGSELW